MGNILCQVYFTPDPLESDPMLKETSMQSYLHVHSNSSVMNFEEYGTGVSYDLSDL